MSKEAKLRWKGFAAGLALAFVSGVLSKEVLAKEF